MRQLNIIIKDFMKKLKLHLLPRLLEIHLESDRKPYTASQLPRADTQDSYSLLSQVIFKGNRIFRHPLLRVNYTTYDLRRETDSINPSTDHCNIMMLAPLDSTDSHPYCYARVLGIYHANVIYSGPESQDYLARRLEFLWVRWLEPVDKPAGWGHCRLDKIKFVPITRYDAFGFVDPADVLRASHIIPAFADGKARSDGIAMSTNAHDGNDWRSYYINR
jgi:hypothetical protein